MTKPSGRSRLPIPRIGQPARGWRSPQPREITTAASKGWSVRCMEESCQTVSNVRVRPTNLGRFRKSQMSSTSLGLATETKEQFNLRLDADGRSLPCPSKYCSYEWGLHEGVLHDIRRRGTVGRDIGKEPVHVSRSKSCPNAVASGSRLQANTEQCVAGDRAEQVAFD